MFGDALPIHSTPRKTDSQFLGSLLPSGFRRLHSVTYGDSQVCAGSDASGRDK